MRSDPNICNKFTLRFANIFKKIKNCSIPVKSQPLTDFKDTLFLTCFSYSNQTTLDFITSVSEPLDFPPHTGGGRTKVKSSTCAVKTQNRVRRSTDN